MSAFWHLQVEIWNKAEQVYFWKIAVCANKKGTWSFGQENHGPEDAGVIRQWRITLNASQ